MPRASAHAALSFLLASTQAAMRASLAQWPFHGGFPEDIEWQNRREISESC